jgi:hypothetical protein
MPTSFSDIKIVDNLVSPVYAETIETTLSGVSVPWHYVSNVTSGAEAAKPGFVHCAFDSGAGTRTELFPLLQPLLEHVAHATGQCVTELLRIRIGLLTKSGSAPGQHNAPHVDYYAPHLTACYYVNDSDGDTVLFAQKLADIGEPLSDATFQSYIERAALSVETSCSPKKNRMLVFDGSRLHASTHPSTSWRRLVVTFNFR